jgi:Tfp pilus assembly protein PilN
VNPVNLLPAKHRPRTPTGGQQGSAYVVVGVLGALLVLVVFYVLTVNGVNSRKDQVARAKATTAELTAQAGELGRYGDFVKVKDERVRSVKDLADGRIDWERLTRGLARLLPNQVWLISASASASGTPPSPGSAGSSAPSPSGSADGSAAVASPKVDLTGCAPDHATVAVTLVRLRELPGATDVTLNEITRPEPAAPTTPAPTTNGSASSTGSASSAPAAPAADGDCGNVHGQPAAKWDATVTFDAKAGTAARGVPKSLGGGS